MGRISRSWDLASESFQILWEDKQLLLFPVLSGISCAVVTLLLVAGSALALQPRLGEYASLFRQNPQLVVRSPELMGALFAIYLANYFVIVFFNVALVGVANSRLTG